MAQIPDQLVRTLERLAQAGGAAGTQRNRRLPAAQVVPAIPPRVGVGAYGVPPRSNT
jgi:hypothetical protein